MGTEFRTVGGKTVFNSGMSREPVPRGKVKGLILVEKGYKLPAEITHDALESAFHADRPGRAYPIKLIDEYAPSGGEAQVNQQGYGASKVSGYSSFTESYTVNVADAGLRANILSASAMAFELYKVTENNIVFGQENNKGELCGIPLSGMHIGGQDFDSSGQVANLILTVIYKDIEESRKLEMQNFLEFNVIESLNGVVSVDLVKTSANSYKIREHYGRLDITMYYAALLSGTNAAKCWNGVTSVTYSDGVLTVVPSEGDDTVSLKSASVLQENGVIGIEQIGDIVEISKK